MSIDIWRKISDVENPDNFSEDEAQVLISKKDLYALRMAAFCCYSQCGYDHRGDAEAKDVAFLQRMDALLASRGC